MDSRIVALAASGVSLAVLVGRDGSPLWQAVRVLVVTSLAAGSIVAVLRLGRRWRGVALLTVGTVATAAGAGFTVPWISKAGAGVTSIAGLVALGAGLGSLVLGVIDIGASLRGWQRWSTVVALVFASGVFAFSLGIAVAATNVPPTDLGDETPADRGLSFEDAEFATDDGATLSGWYLPSTNGAAIVLVHGAGSTRSSVLDHAVVFARHGYGVLLFDSRGHGRSDGRAMDFGWFGDADIGAAADYLTRRPDVDPNRIAVVGMSMGGEEAIGAAAADERIRGVVAEGATGRTARDKAWLSEEYGFRGWLQERLDDVTYWFADLLTDACPPISLSEAAARMAPRPLLLITAGEVPDEALAARHIRAAAPSTVESWEVPQAGHTAGLSIAPGEWEDRALRFLEERVFADG